jgi:hypothetical protein
MTNIITKILNKEYINIRSAQQEAYKRVKNAKKNIKKKSKLNNNEKSTTV